MGDGTPQQWAAESWKLARDAVYRDIPPAGAPPVISEEYIARAQLVVDEQIQKAGVRLAARSRPPTEAAGGVRPFNVGHGCEVVVLKVKQ